MSEAISTDDFAALLSAPEPAAQPETDADPEAPESAEAAPDATAETEEQSLDEAPDDESEQAPALADEAEIEWSTAAGETFKVPVKELKDGYLRQADYTQKAQALAEERKAADRHLQQQFAEVEAFSTDLAQITATQETLKQYQSLDWDALRNADPQQYTLLKLQERDLKDQLQTHAANYQQRKAQVSEMTARQFQQATQEAVKVLARDIPGFSEATVKAMRDYGLKEGFTADELSKVADPRLFKALHKAAQWDALQGKKPEAINRVKTLPPKATVKPQQALPRSRQEVLLKAASSTAPRTTNDFAALLAATRRK